MKSVLKLGLMMLLVTLVSNMTFAQEKRASPAMTAEGSVGEANITVAYSSPAVKGRTIWGDLVPYDKVWRAGANEATTFETSKDVMVEGQALAAGKYSLFIMPSEKEWTVIFNKVAEQWGAYKYDEGQDALRVKVTPTMGDDVAERLKFDISDKGLHFMWDKASAVVSVK